MVEIPKIAYKKLMDDSINLIRCEENIEKLKKVLNRKQEEIKKLRKKKPVSNNLYL